MTDGKRTFTMLDAEAGHLSPSNQSYFHQMKAQMLEAGDSDEDIEMTLRGLIWDCAEGEANDETA